MNEGNKEANVNPEPAPETNEEPEKASVPVESSPASSPATPKRSPKLIIGAIIAAVLVVLLGSAVFGYTMWYQNPDKVVHDAVLNAIKAKSVSSTGTIAYKGDEFAMDLAFDGKAGETGGELSVDAKLTVNSDEIQQEFKAGGVGRMVDGTLYVKLTGITSVVEDTAAMSGGLIPEYAASIFEKIEDKWISIEASDYQEVDSNISKQQACFTELFESMQSDNAMSNEITDLYRNNQILIIANELNSKSVNGTASLGYEVKVDTAAAKTFTEDLEGTEFGTKLKECDDSIDFKDYTEGFSDTSDSEDAPTIELWVSRFGHEITELSVKDDDGSQSVAIVVQPSFDKTVTLEAPSDATSFRTVLEEIQQAILEYYTNAFSEDITIPEGVDFNFDTQLQPQT